MLCGTDREIDFGWREDRPQPRAHLPLRQSLVANQEASGTHLSCDRSVEGPRRIEVFQECGGTNAAE